MAARGGASIRGKQAAVHEGRLLRLLRSVGYRDELPPSTVAWLDTAPVFKFLASRLSGDNFVSPEEQAEFDEVMLARGADASLYDGLDAPSSDGGCDGAADGATTSRPHAQPSNSAAQQQDPFLAGPTDAEVTAALQVRAAGVRRA
jgi:hypothetical protein